MFSPDALTSQTLQSWYNEGKFWSGVIGGVIAVYKVVTWFQDIRAKDLKEIHASVGRLEVGMSNQTVALVGELKEMRSDFRTFYLPLAAQAKPVRARVVKKAAKKKATKKA